VARGKPILPQEAYNSQIPQYLLDFNKAEESPAYRNAVSAIEKLTTPPSLPGFLGKPILNAANLMKDDNSVLNMPNHTVLNHLATGSIRNNVLAVSATTRYHNKVSRNPGENKSFLGYLLTISCYSTSLQLFTSLLLQMKAKQAPNRQ
jgi:hypothetical protein